MAAEPNFIVQHVANEPVKCRIVRPLKQHREIVAILPISALADLRFHQLVESRSRKRIGNGNADVIRALFADQAARLVEIVPILTRIAELDEPAGAYAVRLEMSR